MKRFLILGVTVSVVAALSVAAQLRRPLSPAEGFDRVSLATGPADMNAERTLALYTPGAARLTMDHHDGRDLGPRQGAWERNDDDGLSFHPPAATEMAMDTPEPGDVRPDDKRLSLSSERRILPRSVTLKTEANTVSWGWLADTVQEFEAPSVTPDPLTDPASELELPLRSERDGASDLREVNLTFEREMSKIWGQKDPGESDPSSTMPAPSSSGPRRGNTPWSSPDVEP